MLSLPPSSDPVEGHEQHEVLCAFRRQVYACLEARADALFELSEAVLCAAGPVRSLPELSLEPEHRRGHGSLYDGLNAGKIEITRLRKALDGLPLPRVAGTLPANKSEIAGRSIRCSKH